MKRYTILFQCCIFLTGIYISNSCFGQSPDTISPRYQVTLKEAHIGNLEIDTKLLDSYELLPDNVREFYLSARAVFFGNPDADFTDREIIEAARTHDLPLMGGPMLGNLSEDGVILWVRPSTTDPLVVKLAESDGGDTMYFTINSVEPGVERRIMLNGLSFDTDYKYEVYANESRLAEGGFTTAPASDKKGLFRLTFGSCFHKIGLHNPNLINQILKRNPHAMMLLGDIAVDDRDDLINLHRSDYLLRDVSMPWRQLSANVPLYAAWDDHDYLNNDLSGIPDRFTKADQEALRAVWHQNWNNPENEREGIYCNTRMGPVEVIMLDTRSLRNNVGRGKYGSFLGIEQLAWLKETLKNSEAPFKVVSSGTMWSDYISNGKDSWGTWDTVAREEIFSFIENENISGVLLVSGDRHGARGFKIPKPSGFAFYEFEPASLGGVSGPDALAEDTTNQLFGYHGSDATAFGEFTFNTMENEPLVVFRLIDQFGNILVEHNIPYNKLTPIKE